jgi:hypothetical protein
VLDTVAALARMQGQVLGLYTRSPAIETRIAPSEV